METTRNGFKLSPYRCCPTGFEQGMLEVVLDSATLAGIVSSHIEDETGVGNIFNAPLKSGTNSEDFIKIFEKKILNPIDKFKPEVILVSAGFDAHFRDPLANINLESKDFYKITKMIVDLANVHSNGRIISFLEGGYDLLALSEGIKEHLLALKI